MNSDLLETIHAELFIKVKEYFDKNSDKKNEENSNEIDRITLDLNYHYHEIKKEKLYVWFLSRNFKKKIFWADKENIYYSAGLSSVMEYKNIPEDEFSDVIEDIYTLCESFEKKEGLPLRFYGGVSFYFFDKHNVNFRENEWGKYPQIIFFLPKINLIKNAESLYLELYLKPEDNYEKTMEFIDSIGWDYSEDQYEYYNKDDLTIDQKEYLTNYHEWEEAMNSVYAIFSQPDAIKKIVLSRALKLTFLEPLDPLLIFYRLTKNRPHSVRFYFQFENGSAFMGATPERLYFRNQKKIFTEAIAGTRPRGKDLHEDNRIEKELLESKKDRDEHEFVIESIIDSFGNLKLEAKISATEILKLKNVMHLYTKIESKNKSSASDAELLKSLHPTAAIGGHPRDKAYHYLKQTELLNRGWYASPVGWIEKDHSEFNVAIRSGLVENSHLTLFGGAGIIPESDTKSEWEEIENKIHAFLSSVINENK